MTALLDAVAAAGDRLVRASGGRISFDARAALDRSDEIDLANPGRTSPNGHCRLVPCADGWIAVSLAREDDFDLIPAWTADDWDADPWEAVFAAAARRTARAMVDGAVELHLPVSRLGEACALEDSALGHGGRGDGDILDLSALWAGPYCGALLAEAGYRVTKIECPDRPDPTARHTPKLDARLNGGKQRRFLPLAHPDLMKAIAGARVLITAARPHALARLGLDERALFAINPGLLWIAITAHGWREAPMRVGFGDDCAAAGGLVHQGASGPEFLGDALADPLTGLTAATLALEALGDGRCGLLDVSLARTAASFARSLT